MAARTWCAASTFRCMASSSSTPLCAASHNHATATFRSTKRTRQGSTRHDCIGRRRRTLYMDASSSTSICTVWMVVVASLTLASS